jgi:hypothetical protein
MHPVNGASAQVIARGWDGRLVWTRDTHDCDEGVDGVEEGLVAICLSL